MSDELNPSTTPKVGGNNQTAADESDDKGKSQPKQEVKPRKREVKKWLGLTKSKWRGFFGYSEFLFLSALERRDPKFEYIFVNGQEQQNILGIYQLIYVEMVVALAEDSYVAFDRQDLQLLIGRLRGEIGPSFSRPLSFHEFEWGNPREALQNKLIGGQAYRLRVTYRGLCRIEELRELLKRDRILEPFGVLLDKVTASIGIATTPPESRGKDLETLADGRQTRAKKEGKNRVVAG